MPKCKICKHPFTPKYSTLEKTCQQYECMVEFALGVAKKNAEKKAKIEASEWSVRKKEMTFDNISSDGYRSKIIQPIINEIARYIDYGQPCISSLTLGKGQGGHYISRKANSSISLNLHNIHIQSFHSNVELSGDEARYRLGLIRWYGVDYFEFIEGLRHVKGVDLSKHRLSELKPIITKINRDLKRNPVKRTEEERIKLRNDINTQIGIYLDEFKEK